jgi:hypothetical protein
MHILNQALAAHIEPTAKLLVMGLYAHDTTAGTLPVADVLTMLGLHTTGALRHLRSQLASAGLIETAVNDAQLSWHFLGASVARAEPTAARGSDALTEPSASVARAEPTAARGSDALTEPSASVARAESTAARGSDALTEPSASVARAESTAARGSDALSPPQTPPGRQVGRLINLDQEDNLPTPLPPTAPAEQVRSVRLLRAISVNAKLAAQIAARWGFREVCAFVAIYLADHAAGRCNGAGVLQTRCLAADAAAPHLASDAPELKVVILTQHITAADVTAWRQADTQAAERDGTEAQRRRSYYVPTGYEDIVEH